MRLLVTGGASGLGRAIALGAGARGAKVVIADIDKAGAEAVAQACGGHALVVDLINGDAGQAVEDGAKLLGGLDVLVNNAGYGAGEAFLEMKAETWDRTLHLNVKALALASAAAGRIMMRQKSGRIINITSPASRMALPNYTAYAASKAAVDAITRAAAVALAPHGIRVNSLAPGMMDTPMQRVTEEQLARIDKRNDMEAFLAERTARIPVGRRTSPEEVAETVLWLAFDAPEYITAERLNVSGGLAGYGAGEAFLDMKAETWDRTLGLNVQARSRSASAAAGRIMVAQKSGRIVNITSPASRMALPNYTAYAASKAAVDAITRAAAVALAPHGVRVNSLAPGMMDTPMQRVTEEASRAPRGAQRHRDVPRRAHRAHPGRPAHRARGGRRDRACGSSSTRRTTSRPSG